MYYEISNIAVEPTRTSTPIRAILTVQISLRGVIMATRGAEPLYPSSSVPASKGNVL